MHYIFDVYNTLLFPPSTEDARVKLLQFTKLWKINLPTNIVEAMALGFTIAPLGYLLNKRTQEWRDHLLVNDFENLQVLKKHYFPAKPEIETLIQFIQSFDDWYMNNTEMPCLDLFDNFIKHKQGPVTLLSNANFLQKKKIEVVFGGFENLQILTSCSIGQKKPSVELLNQIIGSERNGFIVGDSLASDIEPAKIINIKYFHITSKQDLIMFLRREISDANT